MDKKGKLVIISAPSGAGKDSVIDILLKRHAKMVHSVSCTTRPARGEEEDGVDYHFISEISFKEVISI